LLGTFKSIGAVVGFPDFPIIFLDPLLPQLFHPRLTGDECEEPYSGGVHP